MSKRIISFLIIFCFITEQAGIARAQGQADLSGLAAGASAVAASDKFRPLHLRSLSYDASHDDIRLLLDKGDAKEAVPQLENSARGLMEYFTIGIALPDSSFWVNLRPDSPDDMIDPELEKTDLGKVLLAADLQLKKDCARYTSPRTREGRVYWDKLYKKAEELYGSSPIDIPALSRPWIVPAEIIVREAQGAAYIYKATLKVMLEEDYLKGSAGYSFSDERAQKLNEYAAGLMREGIVPRLTKEVNSSRAYAALRQAYYSLILAQWFKRAYAGSRVPYAARINSKDISRLTSKTPWNKTTYFDAYKKSFTNGEYNERQTVQDAFGQSVRTYVSGGIKFGAEIGSAMNLATGAVPAIKSALGAVVAAGNQVIIDAAARVSAVPAVVRQSAVVPVVVRADGGAVPTKIEQIVPGPRGLTRSFLEVVHLFTPPLWGLLIRTQWGWAVRLAGRELRETWDQAFFEQMVFNQLGRLCSDGNKGAVRVLQDIALNSPDARRKRLALFEMGQNIDYNDFIIPLYDEMFPALAPFCRDEAVNDPTNFDSIVTLFAREGSQPALEVLKSVVHDFPSSTVQRWIIHSILSSNASTAIARDLQATLTAMLPDLNEESKREILEFWFSATLSGTGKQPLLTDVILGNIGRFDGVAGFAAADIVKTIEGVTKFGIKGRGLDHLRDWVKVFAGKDSAELVVFGQELTAAGSGYNFAVDGVERLREALPHKERILATVRLLKEIMPDFRFVPGYREGQLVDEPVEALVSYISVESWLGNLNSGKKIADFLSLLAGARARANGPGMELMYYCLPPEGVAIDAQYLHSALVLVENGFLPFYALNKELMETGPPAAKAALIAAWKANDFSKSKDFDPNDQRKIALLEYSFRTRFVMFLSKSEEESHFTLSLLSAKIKAFGKREVYPEPDTLTRHALSYTSEEVRRFVEFVNALKKQSDKYGRKVMVVPNLTYGWFLSIPIRDQLEAVGIMVADARVGSTENHNDEYRISAAGRASIFDDATLKFIMEENPLIVVMDGSNSFQTGRKVNSRYPDAHKAFVNAVMLINYVLAGEKLIGYVPDALTETGIIGRVFARFSSEKDRPSRDTFRQTNEHARELLAQKSSRAFIDKLTALKREAGIPDKDYNVYGARYYNPGNYRAQLTRDGNHSRRRERVTPVPTRIEDVAGLREYIRESDLFITSINLLEEDMPGYMNRLNAGVSHRTGSLDDNIEKDLVCGSDGLTLAAKVGDEFKKQYAIVEEEARKDGGNRASADRRGFLGRVSELAAGLLGGLTEKGGMAVAPARKIDPLTDQKSVDYRKFKHVIDMLVGQGLEERDGQGVPTLREVLARLGLDTRLEKKEAYKAILMSLASGKMDRAVIDWLAGDSYNPNADEDEVGVLVRDQNSNPQKQGVFEAVSNSLDAMGFKIGQFGKGVKQLISWLEPGDSIDVYTRRQGGQAFALTLTRGPDTVAVNGRPARESYYISLRPCTAAEFGAAAEAENVPGLEHGTVVRVGTVRKIASSRDEAGAGRPNTIPAIITGIHERFPFVPAAVITTQVNDFPPVKVNGYEHKIRIVPAQGPVAARELGKQGNVHIRITGNSIAIVDDGSGMGGDTVARMFVTGTKGADPFNAEDAAQDPRAYQDKVDAEVRKTTLVQDPSMAKNRVFFARGGEVITIVDIPAEIAGDAVMRGGLMIDLGLLMEVPDSRDVVYLKAGIQGSKNVPTGFQQAVYYAMRQAVDPRLTDEQRAAGYRELTDEEKISCINTLVIGLEELAQGNDANTPVVKAIRAEAKNILAPVVARMEAQGYVFVPDDRQFENLAFPADKKIMFLHDNLFDWKGASSLKRLGGREVPGVTMEGDKQLPLVVFPFSAECREPVDGYHDTWYQMPNGKRIPVLKTGRFVAVPPEMGEELLAAAERRQKGDAEAKWEFESKAQGLGIIINSEVKTSYEVTGTVDSVQVKAIHEIPAGEVDAQAANRFLRQRPALIGAAAPRAAGKEDRQGVLTIRSDGTIIETATGRKVEIHGTIPEMKRLTALKNNYFLGKDAQGRTVLLKYDPEKGIDIPGYLMPHEAFPALTVSPDSRYVIIADARMGGATILLDCVTGQSDRLDSMVKSDKHIFEMNPQFNQGGDSTVIKFTDPRDTFSTDGAGKIYYLLDLRSAKLFQSAYPILTDASGRYSAFIDKDNEWKLIIHGAGRAWKSADFEATGWIVTVETIWQGALLYHRVWFYDGKRMQARYFNAGGPMLSLSAPEMLKPDYVQHCDLNGPSLTTGLGTRVSVNSRKKEFAGNQAMSFPDRSDSLIDNVPAADGVEVYQHDRYDLFMYKHDTVLEAIDPRTGKMYRLMPGDSIQDIRSEDATIEVRAADGQYYRVSEGSDGSRMAVAKLDTTDLLRQIRKLVQTPVSLEDRGIRLANIREDLKGNTWKGSNPEVMIENAKGLAATILGYALSYDEMRDIVGYLYAEANGNAAQTAGLDKDQQELLGILRETLAIQGNTAQETQEIFTALRKIFMAYAFDQIKAERMKLVNDYLERSKTWNPQLGEENRAIVAGMARILFECHFSARMNHAIVEYLQDPRAGEARGVILSAYLAGVIGLLNGELQGYTPDLRRAILNSLAGAMGEVVYGTRREDDQDGEKLFRKREYANRYMMEHGMYTDNDVRPEIVLLLIGIIDEYGFSEEENNEIVNQFVSQVVKRQFFGVDPDLCDSRHERALYTLHDVLHMVDTIVSCEKTVKALARIQGAYTAEEKGKNPDSARPVSFAGSDARNLENVAGRSTRRGRRELPILSKENRERMAGEVAGWMALIAARNMHDPINGQIAVEMAKDYLARGLSPSQARQVIRHLYSVTVDNGPLPTGEDDAAVAEVFTAERAAFNNFNFQAKKNILSDLDELFYTFEQEQRNAERIRTIEKHLRSAMANDARKYSEEDISAVISLSQLLFVHGYPSTVNTDLIWKLAAVVRSSEEISGRPQKVVGELFTGLLSKHFDERRTDLILNGLISAMGAADETRIGETDLERDDLAAKLNNVRGYLKDSHEYFDSEGSETPGETVVMLLEVLAEYGYSEDEIGGMVGMFRDVVMGTTGFRAALDTRGRDAIRAMQQVLDLYGAGEEFNWQVADALANVQIKYYNEHIKGVQEQRVETDRVSADNAEAAWQSVMERRDAFIGQARAAYGDLLKLIPEERRAAVDRQLRPFLGRLYARQEAEITRVFLEQVKEGGAVSIHFEEGSLPFDTFTRNMARVMAVVPGYLERTQASGFSQELNELQERFMVSLFMNVLELALNSDGLIDQPTDDELDLLGLGWSAGSPEQARAVKEIARAVRGVRDAGSGAAGLKEMEDFTAFIANFCGRDPAKNIEVVAKQLARINALSESAKSRVFDEMRQVFDANKLEDLIRAIDDQMNAQLAGQGRAYVVFLTNMVDQIPERQAQEFTGVDQPMPAEGVYTSQIMKLQMAFRKTADQALISVDEMLAAIADHVSGKRLLPEVNRELEDKILKYVRQRPAGASAAENAQNSKDATKGMRGEMMLSGYIQDNKGRKEYVEEAADNGTGALAEVALLIKKSTKGLGQQVDFTGFFGSGKFSVFEGVDRVEIITRNADRAFLFGYRVERDPQGKTTGLVLERIRRIDDPRLQRGVTIRRIRNLENTVPELEWMLTQRSWKTFAGLMTDENFKIFVMDHEGVRREMKVEHEVLAEVEFKSAPQGEDGQRMLRLISAKDMPLQVIDRAGQRIKEIKGVDDEYLELVPKSLRRHVKELGIIIQVPLPCIENRTGFEGEAEHLDEIKKYVAIAFYKALVHKTLTQTSPQFAFEGFSHDWESNDDYWNELEYKERTDPAFYRRIIELTKKIEGNRINEVSMDDLRALMPREGVLDLEKNFVYFMCMLEVPSPAGSREPTMSMIGRRIAVQKKRDARRAEEFMRAQEHLGKKMSTGADYEESDVYGKRVEQAVGIAIGHEQMRKPEKYVVEPRTDNERRLVAFAESVAKYFGIEQVVLLSDEVRFAGCFGMYKGKQTFFLGRFLAQGMDNPKSAAEITDTVIHELAHSLEARMNLDADAFWGTGYIAHLSGFTHDSIGLFAEAMKYVAAVWLYGSGTASLRTVDTGKAGDSGNGAKDGGTAVVKVNKNAVDGSSVPDKMVTAGTNGAADKSGTSDKSSTVDKSGASDKSANPGRTTGGVDLRSLPIVSERAPGGVIAAGVKFPVLSTAELDRECARMEKMAACGMAISARRIADFAGACRTSGKVERYSGHIRDLAAEVMRCQEAEADATEPELLALI